MRQSRRLIVLGYLVVVAGYSVFVVSAAPGLPAGFLVYEIAVPVSYAALAWAWWTLVTLVGDRTESLPGLGRPLAGFTWAAGAATVGHGAYVLQLVTDHVGPNTLVLGEGLLCVGSALVTAGFWCSARRAPKSRSSAVADSVAPGSW